MARGALVPDDERGVAAAARGVRTAVGLRGVGSVFKARKWLHWGPGSSHLRALKPD
ncbi:hypothetical protein MICRO8M_60106 [Microbacterium sp. 8M]|nr:hypothetical protein MICRO8M_60106 [Microbacterium sp. 8M]